MDIRTVIFAALVLIFLVPGRISAQEADRIKWVSLDGAMDYSKRQNKMILVFIQTEWCGWCKMMEKKTFQNQTVINYMNENYFAVRMDVLQKEDIWFKGFRFQYMPQLQAHQLAYQLLDGKLKYPSLVIMNYKAEVITPIYGFMDGKQLVKILTYYAEGIYETQSWDQYRRQRK